MVCWYCYWGWPKKVADIYLKALKDLNGYEDPLHYGPAHLVWEDENFDAAQWCLDDFDRFKGHFTDMELEAVKKSLMELAEIPLNECCVEPIEYDGEHPELFPHLIMLKWLRYE